MELEMTTRRVTRNLLNLETLKIRLIDTYLIDATLCNFIRKAHLNNLKK